MDVSSGGGIPEEKTPFVIVIGNEKGGSGKSTTAVHLIVALRRQGYEIGSIDLDTRQRTLSHYLENRRRYAEDTGRTLLMPEHRDVVRADTDSRAAAEEEERQRLESVCASLGACHFIVIDTPGSDITLSRLAHQMADALITPLNDSFLDIDVLARIDRQRREVLAPSAYSQMVWEQNNRRVIAGRPPIDWIVMRNRLTHIDARNKREIAGLMTQLAQRIGFRLAPGFGERVIFRELFLKGLTLLDLPDADPEMWPNPSHDAARWEIEALMRSIGLTEQTAA